MSSYSNKRTYYPHELLMRYAKRLGFGDIHSKIDPQTGLHAIIAVHSTDLGPAIGGCRYYPYETSGHAVIDAMRLAHMMTLKAAISNLPHGGAKSVIIAPKKSIDRTHLFKRFGEFVHELNGRYITACDVGTSTDDMDIIATRTPYVIGAAKTHEHETTPSVHTAKGVFLGMKAAIGHKLQRDDFDGIRVAVQGAGSVAFYLCQFLVEAGAIVTVCDPNPDAIHHIQQEVGVNVCEVDSIYDVDCDIFSPCALGHTVNLNTINRLSAKIIAGSANNQLAHPRIATVLMDKDILYAPDFVINSGGLINAAIVYDYADPGMADKKIDQLQSTLSLLFERSAQKNLNTQQIAFEIALQKLLFAKQENKQPLLETREKFDLWDSCYD